jgi:hypothetical protein
MTRQRLIEACLREARAERGDRSPGPVRDTVHAFRMISRIGIRVTFSHAVAVALIRLHHHLIDRRLHPGIPQSLSGRVWLMGLTLCRPDGTEAHEALPCAPVPSKTFHWSLAATRIDATQYHFVDIGSGWGHAVLLASGYPFRRVTGVEFARELYERACANLVWARGKNMLKAGQVEFRYESALETALPDGPTLFFLFHPFGEPVMRAFLERIERSIRENPRPITLIYVNPADHHLFERAGIVEVPLRGRTAWLLKLLSPFAVRVYEFEVGKPDIP